MPLNHHPTFDHYPRILARHGDDPQVFELFRAEPGRSVSSQEIRGYVSHLSPGWHWWVAHTTPPRELIGDRPRMHETGANGRPRHPARRPRAALSTAEIRRLVGEGIVPPNPVFNGPLTYKRAAKPVTQPPEIQATT